MKLNARSTKICLMVGLVAALAAWPVMAQEAGAEEEAPEPNWKNELGLSYVGTSGNTDTSSFGLDYKGNRKPTPWGLDFLASFTRAEDGGVVTAEQYYAGVRGLRQLNDRWSLFAGLELGARSIQRFRQPLLAEAGAEFIAVKSETPHPVVRRRSHLDQRGPDSAMTMSPMAGVHRDRRLVRRGRRSQVGLGLLASLPRFPSGCSITPTSTTSADWRLGSDTAVTASLTKLLALQFSYLVRYRNQPIGDNEKTDTTTKASVVLNF